MFLTTKNAKAILGQLTTPKHFVDFGEHVTVSGGWREQGKGVTCNGFCGFGRRREKVSHVTSSVGLGGGRKRCHMLQFLGLGGEGKRCHM